MYRDRRGKTPGKHGRRATDKTGEAVCDMKGDLWEIDATFLIYMKQMVPGWCGGNIPTEVMDRLKNTGSFAENGILLMAQPKDNSRIILQIKDAS